MKISPSTQTIGEVNFSANGKLIPKMKREGKGMLYLWLIVYKAIYLSMAIML